MVNASNLCKEIYLNIIKYQSNSIKRWNTGLSLTIANDDVGVKLRANKLGGISMRKLIRLLGIVAIVIVLFFLVVLVTAWI